MMPEPEHPLPCAATPADPAQPTAAEPLHVFVYGTLRAGGSNDIQRHRPPPQWIGNAVVAGTLYDFGGWPGLQLQGDTAVVGEVWRIDPSIEPQLDRLEGVRDDGRGEYLKRRMQLRVDGRPVACLLYEINLDRARGRPIISGGDWIAHLAPMPAPAHPSQTSGAN